MEPQDLGELKTVPNTLRNNKSSAENLIVGWVMFDGDLKGVAFTKRELQRPLDRAEDNKEDIPALAAKPPTHAEYKELGEKCDELTEKLGKWENWGFFARLFNKRPY